MDPQITNAITFFVAFLFSLTIHEAAHAWTAKLCGDSTAAQLGRMSLNPIVHIDLIGTILLPLAGAIFGIPLIAWAKPVPVNPNNFRKMRFHHALVAGAGPGSNLLLCFICVVALAIYQTFLQDIVPETNFFYPIIKLTQVMVQTNAILAFFNLIPLPPLDGGTVFSQILLPYNWGQAYERYVSPYGVFILLMVIWSGGLGWVFSLARSYINMLVFLVNSVI